MTGVALVAEVTAVIVLLPVAGHALGFQLIGERIVTVTVVAVQFAMAAL